MKRLAVVLVADAWSPSRGALKMRHPVTGDQCGDALVLFRMSAVRRRPLTGHPLSLWLHPRSATRATRRIDKPPISRLRSPLTPGPSLPRPLLCRRHPIRNTDEREFQIASISSSALQIAFHRCFSLAGLRRGTPRLCLIRPLPPVPFIRRACRAFFRSAPIAYAAYLTLYRPDCARTPSAHRDSSVLPASR